MAKRTSDVVASKPSW
jgi:hypothetical protein